MGGWLGTLNQVSSEYAKHSPLSRNTLYPLSPFTHCHPLPTATDP